jgi:hypothetical protein
MVTTSPEIKKQWPASLLVFLTAVTIAAISAPFAGSELGLAFFASGAAVAGLSMAYFIFIDLFFRGRWEP